MSPHQPEDWPRLFEQHLNAGDLEAVMALYEPEARFPARSGETVVGRDRIRDVLAGMIRSKTKLLSRVIKAITVDDVALLYTDFQGTAVDASEKTIEIGHKAIEVLRLCHDAREWNVAGFTAWELEGIVRRPFYCMWRRIRDFAKGFKAQFFCHQCGWLILQDDEAAAKLIYLALRDITKKWKNPPVTWKLAATQFAIRFGHRFFAVEI